MLSGTALQFEAQARANLQQALSALGQGQLYQ